MNRKFDFKSISSSQTYIDGDLQRLLRQGEYPPFTSDPILESKFVQVNRRGDPISLHNRASCVTIGICGVDPSSETPNVMLVAREVPTSPQKSTTNFCKLSEQPSHMQQLELTRFFPLKFVELSVHSTDMHHLMLKLVNGHCYYLELCAPPEQQEQLFHLWLQLISLLKDPEKTSNTEVKRDNPQDVRNPKTEEEVTKQTSSNQVTLLDTVGLAEESGRKGEAFHSSLKPTRQENVMQSKNIDPLDTKKTKSTEKRKTRTTTRKLRSGKKIQISGNHKSGSTSSRLLQILSQVIRQ